MGSYLFLATMLAATFLYSIYYPVIKGKIGEWQITNLLKKLDPSQYILLNDLYILKENGQTTQVDHVLISNKGVFVIETKNYKGWIMGSEGSQYWTQINYKRKDKFYNPIWQNAGHIKALQDYLGDNLTNVPMYSIVVFGNQATLKFKEPFKKAYVIKGRELLAVIEGQDESNVVSSLQMQKINQLLSNLYIGDRKEKRERNKKHISDIKKNLNEKKSNESSIFQPKSGSVLGTRNGKNDPITESSSFLKTTAAVPPSIQLSVQESGDIKIGALVRLEFDKLISQNMLSPEKVVQLTDGKYCKNTFNLNFPLLKKITTTQSILEQRQINGYSRYWNQVYVINGEKYIICNDWYERHRLKFKNWLIQIYK